MRRNVPTSTKLLIALACLLAGTSTVWPCTIPVFRYALDYWPPDNYELIVFCPDDLAENDRTAIEQLTELSENESVNLVVHQAKPSGEMTPAIEAVWQRQKSPSLPWAVVCRPSRTPFGPQAWAGPFEADTIKQWVDSPVRRRIAGELAEGKAAVWVLLESGDRQADDKAEKELKTQLEKITPTLKPGLEPSDMDAFNANLPVEPWDIEIAFSVIRVSRNDPSERVLVDMLLDTEPDLRELDGPMFFPIYGRGRALYALINKGINAYTIEKACQFVVGGCSCQVKAQNPGADLLIAFDWKKAIEGLSADGFELLPLIGVPAVTTQPGEATDEIAANTTPLVLPTTDETDSTDPLVRNIVLAVVVGLLIAGGAGLIFKTRVSRPR